MNKITAGGDIRVAAPAGGPARADRQDPCRRAGCGDRARWRQRDAGQHGLAASGKLTMLSAELDVVLGDGARLDLAGRKIDFYDVSKYSWGGDVVLESRNGDVRQSAGSRIDLSAAENRAGKLTALALGAGRAPSICGWQHPGWQQWPLRCRRHAGAVRGRRRGYPRPAYRRLHRTEPAP
ncbi:hypothetical protein ACU4GD_19595 [Cupriavidus basilensis]